jgi:hypothetical protein
MSNLPKKTYGELLREESRKNWNEIFYDDFTQFQTFISALFEGTPRWGEVAEFATPAAREFSRLR